MSWRAELVARLRGDAGLAATFGTRIAFFEAARSWAPGGAAPQAVDSEAAAAELLIEAVRATSAGSWSLAAARLDELLRDHGDTLLVRLLSDGRGAKLGAGDGR